MISTTTEWGTATLSEAGFAPDVEERFEVAREAGVCQTCMGLWPPATDASSSSVI